MTALPDELFRRSPRKSSDGFATGSRPSSVILKTPISSTLPNRFLIARRMRWSSIPSPSKYRTVSTMCSSVFGPAIPPPLRNVSDDEDRSLRFLREAHQPRGALAHLPDISRRTLEIARENGLNGIDDDASRAAAIQRSR